MAQTIERPAIIASGLPDLGIYVACLASYNSGRLEGCWLDLSSVTDADEISSAIQWMLQQSPAAGAEEYAIHDSTGLPSFLRSTEWPDLADLAQYAATLEDVGESNTEAYRLACENESEVITEDAFSETYCGRYESGEDYAQQFHDDCSTDLGPLASYIDWERVWRDCTYQDHWEERAADGGVHIFRSF